MKKIIALCLCVLMIAALCCCTAKAPVSTENNGGAAQTEAAAPKVDGETQTHGNLTVFIPKGMNLVPGDMFDEENPDALTIQDENDAFNYVMVTIYDSDTIDSNMEMTKEFNEDCEFTDISKSLSNGSFTGFFYESWGTPCVNLKGELSGNYVQISAAGFEADSDAFIAILESIVVAAN